MATARTSAGLIPYRRAAGGALEVLVGHMGGPLWARKDAAAWSIFKGEYVAGEEEPIDVARREFTEETGQPTPPGALVPLGEIRQGSGKRVAAWAVEAPSLDPATFVSNTFEMEWPPRSGRRQSFPEIDRAAWLTLAEAEEKLIAGQVPLLATLRERLGAGD